MENLRTSSYTIPIQLENEKYMLIHGYTGAVDVVDETLVAKLIQHESVDENIFSFETRQSLEKRGYITSKTKEEEYDYAARIAKALHKRDEILYKSFTWIVTYNCNFRCPYCFENRDIKDSSKSIPFTKERVNRTFDAMNEIEPRIQLQSNIITLYGGEPLLKENRNIIEYIVKTGQEKGYKFHAVTNGYDLENFMDLLAPDKICQVQITIDGTQKYHNQKRKHCQDPNSFDKIISNIHLILNAKIDIKISIRVNTDRNNLIDFIKLKEYFKQSGFLDYENFTVYSAMIMDNDSMSTGDKDNLNIMSTKDYIHQHAEMGTLSSCNGYSVIYNNIYHAIRNKKTIPLKATYCSAQTGGHVFSPFGEIYPCWEVVGNKKYEIGNLTKDSILWNNETLTNWRSHDIRSSACKHCKYAFLCGGGCQALKNNHCIYFQEILKKAASDVYKQVCAPMFN